MGVKGKTVMALSLDPDPPVINERLSSVCGRRSQEIGKCKLGFDP